MPSISSLSWMVCEIGSKWLYSCCFMKYYFQDLFKTTHNIFVLSSLSFFSMCLVRIQVVHPCSSTYIATAWKKSHFILSDIHMINNLSTAIHIFPIHILTSLSVDEILLLRYMNWGTNFRGLLFKVEMAPSCLNHMNSISS